jgi:hypothetical protein
MVQSRKFLLTDWGGDSWFARKVLAAAHRAGGTSAGGALGAGGQPPLKIAMNE